MTSDAQSAAKRRTSLSAPSLTLAGQIHLLSPEEQAAFDAHCQGVREGLAPVGAPEIDLAQALAENYWRLKRIRALETGIFAAGQGSAQSAIDASISQARTWLAESDKIVLLTDYEQRIERRIERDMAELRTLQAERKAARQQAIEEALLLAQLAKSKGEAYHPAADFSADEIARAVARHQRLAEAREYAQKGTRSAATPRHRGLIRVK